MVEWLDGAAHWNGAGWGLVVLITLVASMAVVALFVLLIPPTYFADAPGRWPNLPRGVRWSLLIAKNLLGYVLIVAGVVMLVTPGQGILTILIGIALINFPGKRTLQRKLVGRPGVLHGMNRLRARFGRPPLRLEPGQPTGAPVMQRVRK